MRSHGVVAVRRLSGRSPTGGINIPRIHDLRKINFFRC